MTHGRWEYFTYTLYHRTPASPTIRSNAPEWIPGSYQDWLGELNALGADGWEVVAPIPVSAWGDALQPAEDVLLLKRRVD